MVQWGAAIGRMHAARRNYAHPESIHSRPQWDQERNYVRIQNNLDRHDGKMRAWFRRLDPWLKALPKSGSDYGLIHADVHHGNFHVNDRDEVTVFDFDDCHYHWFAYDIAVPIFSLTHALARKGAKFDWSRLSAAFWTGLSSENQYSAACIEAVDRFVEFRSLVMYYWCASNLGRADLDDKSREWMEKTMTYCLELAF